MKKDQFQEPMNLTETADSENTGIQKDNEANAEVFICDECGDTLWDAVLEQEGITGK